MKNIALLITSFLILLIAASCTHKQELYSEKEGGIVLQNNKVKLVIDDNMHFQITDIKLLKSINVKENTSSNYIVIDGKKVDDFVMDKTSIKHEIINNELGKVKKLEVKAKSESSPITQTLVFIQSHDDAIITKVKYENSGTETLVVDKIVNNKLLLDAKLVDPNKRSNDFWTYMGAAYNWGKDYILPLSDTFNVKNYIGENPETKVGGGNPIIDIWNNDFGIAIAHLETVPKQVSFPIKVQEDKKVSICIEQAKEDFILKTGESVESIKTAIIYHKLDYFDALRIYSNVMATQGIKMPTPSPEAYKAMWCGWGYKFNFTEEQIMCSLPMVEKLGVKWVVIDDRWFDKYGDWNPRKDNFPGGEEQIKNMVKNLHAKGYKVKIWWMPSEVQGTDRPPKEKFWINWDFSKSGIAKKHPDWIIKDKDGKECYSDRYLWYLCPSLPEVQDYVKALTEKFIRDWDFDGHKLDAYYVVPPCYNPEHHHKHPEESYEDLPKLFKIIYETTKKYKPEAVVELCNCGVPQDFFQSVWTDQPVTSDPQSSFQVRSRIKSMKALWGDNAPVYADQVEFIDGDFASGFGPGGVLGSKFTWPEGNPDYQLNPEKEKHWEKWISLYQKKMLSKGDYQNLYDIAYDKPETHVIKKDNVIYFSFFADEWNGEIDLRGLEDKKYKVYDYVNNKNICNIDKGISSINVSFKDYLFIECIPE